MELTRSEVEGEQVSTIKLTISELEPEEVSTEELQMSKDLEDQCPPSTKHNEDEIPKVSNSVRIKQILNKIPGKESLKKAFTPSIVGAQWSSPSRSSYNGRKPYQGHTFIRYSNHSHRWNYCCSLYCPASIGNRCSQRSNSSWHGAFRSVIPVHTSVAICNPTCNEHKYNGPIVWSRRK